MKRSQRVFISGLFILIGIIAFLWGKQMEPGFFARNFLAALYADMQSQPIVTPFRGNVPGMRVFLATLHLVTDIPLENLAYVPVGAFTRAVFYAALVYSLTRNSVASVALALMTAVYPWAGWGYSSVFVHSLGAPLFLAVVLVCLTAARGEFRSRESVLVVLLIVGLYLFDYTANVWVVAMLLALGAFAVVGRVQHRPPDLSRPTRFVVPAVFGAALYWTKNTSLVYLGMVTRLDPVAALVDYFATEPKTRGVPYEYDPNVHGLGTSNYFYLLLLVPIGVYGLVTVYQVLRKRRPDFSGEEYVIGAMIFGGGAATLLYTFMGRFNQFFIFVCFPIIGVACVRFLGQRVPSLPVEPSRLASVLAVALLLLAGGETAALVAAGDYSRDSPAAVEPGAQWLFTHSENPSVLTGLKTRGRMRMTEERVGEDVDWLIYNETSYPDLVEGRGVPGEYVVADFETEWGTKSMNNWQIFESLGRHRSAVDSNEHLDRVYSSKGLGVYHSPTGGSPSNVSGQRPDEEPQPV